MVRGHELCDAERPGAERCARVRRERGRVGSVQQVPGQERVEARGERDIDGAVPDDRREVVRCVHVGDAVVALAGCDPWIRHDGAPGEAHVRARQRHAIGPADTRAERPPHAHAARGIEVHRTVRRRWYLGRERRAGRAVGRDADETLDRDAVDDRVRLRARRVERMERLRLLPGEGERAAGPGRVARDRWRRDGRARGKQCADRERDQARAGHLRSVATAASVKRAMTSALGARLTRPDATCSLTAHMPLCIVLVMRIALPMLGADSVRSGGGS